MAQFKQKRKRKRDTKRIARIFAILIIFGLIASFFIGSIGAVSAQAATTDPTQIACVTDIDADGVLNAVDPDIDGDGVINGEDDDMDGDSLTNFEDQDPAATNCTLGNPLPIKPKVVDSSAPIYIALTVFGILIAAPLSYLAAKRRKKK